MNTDNLCNDPQCCCQQKLAPNSNIEQILASLSPASRMFYHRIVNENAIPPEELPVRYVKTREDLSKADDKIHDLQAIVDKYHNEIDCLTKDRTLVVEQLKTTKNDAELTDVARNYALERCTELEQDLNTVNELNGKLQTEIARLSTALDVLLARFPRAAA